ncbi:Endonuclease/exonuclease/phosphatase [Aspergillus pseudodeflectus]|uniref:Endonuclease/exonuclease/phosphatase n=1 Tax=Aspergillus pseudodeflectus TaxID=176178 RepID=A0ABR4KHI7_9EURO
MASNEERSPGPKIGEYPSDHDSLEVPAETTSDPSSLCSAVKARKDEYTRHQTVHVKVGTWNVAAIAGTEKDVGKWFVQRRGVYGQLSGSYPAGSQRDEGPEPSITEGGASSIELPPDQVGLYVLGLQEIVDLSSPTEALRPYTDPAPAKRWKEAVEAALPPGYKLVAEIQLVGLLQLIYAAPSIADSVSAVSNTSVGTGLLGYMGNKGAVATRLLLGETTCMIFVNCHLAAGSDKASLDRRNWDASQIVGRAKFDSIDPDYTLRDELSESIGDEDFAFWFGDLNYRLEDIPGDDVRQVLARHTENEYDKRHQRFAEVNGAVSSPRVANEDARSQSPVSEELPNKVQSLDLEDLDPHQDPASLQTTISSLFPHDQLRMQQDKQKAFHEGWREGQISFLPTYKYDVGSVARFDSSEKHRGPSWCDRILYRSRRDKQRYERLVKEVAEARKRDEEMKARGLESAAADDSVLFDYDPDVDGVESGDEYDPDEDEAHKDAPPDLDAERDDGIRLDYYLSHQGVLSSDHKPLVAGFTLELKCVDPKLKAQVHQEVVRELDKAENESRPGLTVVVDNHGHETSKRSETDPNDVDFGAIKLNVPVSRSVTVANTSGVSATFSIQKPERGAETPSWLEFRVEPPHHDESGDHKPELRECTLLPGDIAMVEITVCVRDIDFVRLLNDGQVKLEEILVLRVKDGKDHFISAYGEWLPTAFGRSLEELTHIPEAGARSLTKRPANSHEDEHRVPISAPRELFKLTEAISELTERAVAEWDMVKGETEDKAPWEREPHGAAWPFGPETWTLKDKEARSPLLAQARDALDTNTDFSKVFAPEVSSMHRLEVLSETLVSFLRSLKDGVISASLWQDLDQQIQTREKARLPPRSWEDSQAWVLENLAYSPAHSVSFTFVTFMLARIANEIAPVPSKPPPPTNEPKDTSRDSKDGLSSPSSPVSAASFISGGSFRRKPVPSPPSAQDTTITTMNHRRQAVETALATFFSSVLISTQVPVPSKDRERRALEERKRSIIEPFLKAIGVDNNGPSGGAP